MANTAAIACADGGEPERLRDDDVAKQQRPEHRRIGAGEFENDQAAFGMLAAVPGVEPFGGVGQPHDDRRRRA